MVRAAFTIASHPPGYSFLMSNEALSAFNGDDGLGPVGRDKRYTVFLRGVIGRAGSRNRMPLIVRNISSSGLRGECAYPPHACDEVEVELPGLGAVIGHVRWDAGETFGMLCVRSMREVEPRYVEPSRDELPQPILTLARRSNGSYNLGASHTTPTS